MRTIQLINAPLAASFCPSIRAGAFPPLHLVSLANFLQRHCPKVGVEIIDGELCGLGGTLACLDSDFVGISCNSLTYENALHIAKIAKQQGAEVILGGAHPTFAGRQIIGNRPFIDGVVYGDGEEALLRLAKGQRYAEIPNLIYRDSAQICVNNEVKLRLDDLPFPDYRGMPVEPYFRNYGRLYPDKPFRRAFAAYSAKGCQWRDRSGGGCAFCAIQHLGFRIKSVERFWAELIEVQKSFSAEFFWDVSDTFTMQRDWIRRFAATKPAGTNIQFQVYGRAPDITEEVANLLARIGVYEVFLGLESGSNKTLRASHKGATVRSNLQAIRNLNREGVRVVISVIIGLPGESEETLSATMDMVEDILGWGTLSEINCSILLPLPGSQVMASLENRVPPKKGQEDLFNPDMLRRSWVENFCEVSYERLIDAQGEMKKLHKRVGTFGQTISEQSRQLDIQKTETEVTIYQDENMSVPVRFSRNIGVLTECDQAALARSTVAIVGLGCTGCAITEFLGRAGVGGFILIDGDRFEETNINRQLYARPSTIGEFKAEEAQRNVLEVNPEARVIAHAIFLQPDNAQALIEPSTLVINGLDDPFATVVLHRTARMLGKTSVFVLSGCIPFQGVCTTIPAESPVDYETLMGMPTAGKALDPPEEIRRDLFEKVTKSRLVSALKRGALPGDWVENRLQGGWVPSFGITSNIVSLIAANEAIKTLIGRPNLPPVYAPKLIYFDGAACEMHVRHPESGELWFQGNF